ncbi:NAD-dependent epimerase/dehydratase family protein [Actinomadura yumaensis]|uniref:NAD-dependent epimerase/dehydratase family protein n=1 Tax=Actinomadura yumaensis TaxID=111807 RepID=A0ABW2CNJ3_9ACTN
MHVFLAGATGVLGRRIVPRLLADGHRVTALVRDDAGAAAVEAAGATPARADAFDAGALARAVAGAAPDAVMHQLTDLARGDSSANAHMRRTGTRNLVDAAKAAGVRRVVAQSIAWVYEPGPGPADEATPLDLGAAPPRRTTVEGVAALETAVRELPEWVVLRYGLLYGPDTWYTPGGLMAAKAKAGELVAGGDVSSFVHVDDAADAAVRALGWPSGPVNVCDDEPLAAREWLPAFCRAVGAPPPPASDAPRDGAARGASNRYARERLGWTPAHPVFSP